MRNDYTPDKSSKDALSRFLSDPDGLENSCIATSFPIALTMIGVFFLVIMCVLFVVHIITLPNDISVLWWAAAMLIPAIGCLVMAMLCLVIGKPPNSSLDEEE